MPKTNDRRIICVQMLFLPAGPGQCSRNQSSLLDEPAFSRPGDFFFKAIMSDSIQ